MQIKTYVMGNNHSTFIVMKIEIIFISEGSHTYINYSVITESCITIQILFSKTFKLLGEMFLQCIIE